MCFTYAESFDSHTSLKRLISFITVLQLDKLRQRGYEEHLRSHSSRGYKARIGTQPGCREESRTNPGREQRIIQEVANGKENLRNWGPVADPVCFMLSRGQSLHPPKKDPVHPQILSLTRSKGTLRDVVMGTTSIPDAAVATTQLLCNIWGNITLTLFNF